MCQCPIWVTPIKEGTLGAFMGDSEHSAMDCTYQVFFICPHKPHECHEKQRSPDQYADKIRYCGKANTSYWWNKIQVQLSVGAIIFKIIIMLSLSTFLYGSQVVSQLQTS